MQHHPSPSPACAPAAKNPKYLRMQIGGLNQDFCSIQFDGASKALNRTTFSLFSPCPFYAFCCFTFFWNTPGAILSTPRTPRVCGSVEIIACLRFLKTQGNRAPEPCNYSYSCKLGCMLHPHELFLELLLMLLQNTITSPFSPTDLQEAIPASLCTKERRGHQPLT